MNKTNSRFIEPTAGKSRAKKPWWKSWLILGTSLCLLLLVAGITWMITTEVRAYQILKAKIQQRQDQGLPIDNASLAKWFEENTHSEGTKAWREILQLSEDVNGLGYYELHVPYISEAELSERIDPDAPWDGEAQVAEFLNIARPLLDRIEDATQHSTPVWQPIQFDGYNTLLPELQMSRGVSRVLCVEIEHALYRRDADRALRGLKSLRHLVDTFDWDISLVNRLVTMAIQNMYYSMIFRSLSCEVWQAAHAEQLLAQIGPARELGSDWKVVFDCEMAYAMAMANAPEQLGSSMGQPNMHIAAQLLTLPSSKLQLFDDYLEISNLGQGGYAELRRNAQAISDQIEQVRFSANLSQMLIPSTMAVASSFERTEDWRRLCCTAIGVKLFQVRNGRWPKNLGELGQVGLLPADATTITGGPIGYSVEEEGAYVWTRDMDSYNRFEVPQRVPATRPVVLLNKHAVTLIR